MVKFTGKGREILRRPQGLFFCAVIVSALTVHGQQVQFPQSGASNAANPWNPPLNLAAPPAYPSGSSASPWPSSSGTLGGPAVGPATVTPLGPPVPSSSSLSPYTPGLRPNSSPVLPPNPTSTFPPTGSGWNLGSWFGTNPMPPTTYSNSTGLFPNTYPSSVYPNQAPPALFPGGYGTPSTFNSYPPTGQSSVYPNGMYNPNATGLMSNPTAPLWTSSLPNPTRFFVTPRFRHSWLAGDDQAESLGINDSDVSAVFQVPGFLGSTQPLYIVPSFSSHLWDGPSTTDSDLPPAAYSAFLDFGWEADPSRTFGTELGIRVGAFTDYDTFNSESLRILGKILGRVRLTPSSTFRLGAYWLDRNRIKLLPAVGILWTPNADTRFDLFFPEPKLSHYLTTCGTKDMWWYVSGYYGGGAWTIERADGSSDNIDINDVRIVIGLEWGRNELLRQGHRVAFVEGGYVFNRELIYRISPSDNLDIDNTFTLRAGWVY